MRRADRLFQIIQHLRRRRTATTAAALAQVLEVSERTVYRDIADLMVSGVPIDGAAGVGYRLRPGFDLPPLMFTAIELQALQLGAQIVRAWADTELAGSANSALERIAAALPEPLRRATAAQFLFAPDFFVEPATKAWMGQSREAMTLGCKVRIDYRDSAGATTERTLEPLGLYFWGNRWTLGAWCDTRQDFRTFRLDRIAQLRPLPGTTRAHTADDYVRHVTRQDE